MHRKLIVTIIVLLIYSLSKIKLLDFSKCKFMQFPSVGLFLLNLFHLLHFFRISRFILGWKELPPWSCLTDLLDIS